MEDMEGDTSVCVSVCGVNWESRWSLCVSREVVSDVFNLEVLKGDTKQTSVSMSIVLREDVVPLGSNI